MKTASITRFPLPEGIPLETLQKGFEEASSAFAQVPGLIQKVFLVSPDLRYAGGSYLWQTLEHAQSFSESALREMIRQHFGVECEITYFHAPVAVEGPGCGVKGAMG